MDHETLGSILDGALVQFEGDYVVTFRTLSRQIRVYEKRDIGEWGEWGYVKIYEGDSGIDSAAFLAEIDKIRGLMAYVLGEVIE